MRFLIPLIIIFLIRFITTEENICDAELNGRTEDWPPFESVSVNTRLASPYAQFIPLNGTHTLKECAHKCCEQIKCNFVFLKESQFCYLITCSDDSCIIEPNNRKSKAEMDDYLVKIRSIDETADLIEQILSKEKTELEKIKYDLLDEEEHQKSHQKAACYPDQKNTGCSLNEICALIKSKKRHECVCPKERNLFRIDGVCREYLPNHESCMMNLDKCELNEECLSLNELSKHGTCQCKYGYRRNYRNQLCEPVYTELDQIEPKLPSTSQIEITSSTVKNANSRRRPAPGSSSDDEDLELNKNKDEKLSQPEETLLQKIFNEIVGTTTSPIETSTKQDELAPTVSTQPTQPNKQALVFKTTSNQSDLNSTEKTSTLPTITTTQQTTTVLTDPPKIFTSDLQANAGPDIHVYYPSRLCILNGTLTTLNTTPLRQITKWEWSKEDSSPAFGHFVNTNEAPIVVYEQLVEGEYRFLLKVWTNDNEFSQDTVHVYVHANSNSNKNLSSRSLLTLNSSSRLNEDDINDNIIQIELDLNPSMFSEYLKEQFLTKLQILLQQHTELKLKEPRVILVNTKVIQSQSAKTIVLLELIVTDLIDESLKTIDLKISQIESVYTENVDLIGENRKIVKSAGLIKFLRKKQKSFKNLLDSVQTLILSLQSPAIDHDPQLNSRQFSTLEFLDLKILGISQLTCTDENEFSSLKTQSNKKYNCSNHGKCDMYSHKCVCNKYWMHNLYLYYFDYESDLTNGNNCEYNIPLVTIIGILLGLITFFIIKFIFKYVFYYLFCCCCCSNKSSKNNKLKRRNQYVRGLIRDDSYLDDSNDNLEEFLEDDYDDEEKPTGDKRSLITKSKQSFLSKLRNVPGSSSRKQRHKYALLQDEENDSLNSSRGRFFKKNGFKEEIQMGAQLKYNDDNEDIVYEESMMKRPNENNNQNNIKKYNVI